ncbi:MAG: hypothetical protein GY822_27510 [Deltaproteobacteria bacterium]|nr:hypothetical protein [Deltaproteobacteria bacterium]
MAENEFFIPNKPEPRVQVQPKEILGSFGLQALKTKFYNIDDPERDAPVATSYLGTPVFSNLFFGEDEETGGSYRSLEGEQIDWEPIEINTVLFSVNQQKNIVRTPIQGRNGTVKEYISDGDFDITIRGLIVSPDAETYPKEDVLKLVKILKVQDNLPIASRFLNEYFDITNIVVASYSLPENEGFQNVQAFEINAYSDEPVEISIKSR